MPIAIRRPALMLTAATLLAAALPSMANASDVRWSITVGSSRPAPVYAPPPVVYVQPQPVYVQPQPVYVQPQPVYVTPHPVYVQPHTVYVQPGTVVVGQPVYVYEPHHRKGKHRHWKHRRDHREHHDYRY